MNQAQYGSQRRRQGIEWNYQILLNPKKSNKDEGNRTRKNMGSKLFVMPSNLLALNTRHLKERALLVKW